MRMLLQDDEVFALNWRLHIQITMDEGKCLNCQDSLEVLRRDKKGPRKVLGYIDRLVTGPLF